MKNAFRILLESVLQAWHQLVSNKLRSALSILGVTIGIFCIVSVQSAVNSLQTEIQDTFSAMGSNVLYVDKYPWDGSVNENNFRKFESRPHPDLEDLKTIKENVSLAEEASIAYFTGGKTIKYRSDNVQGSFIMGVSAGYEEIIALGMQEGRFLNSFEFRNGDDKVVLGYKVATALFGNLNPVGKYVKMLGRKYQVVGMIEKQGESMFDFIPYDEAVIIAVENMRKSYVLDESSRMGRLFNVLPKEGVDLDELKEEVTGALRAGRKLRPIQDNDFALNEQSMINDAVDQFFASIRVGGFVIGIFALLVGMFGVANIMFVSVNERTKIIGIKKAIGAKPILILFEFLIEAVVLCLVGGAVGMLFVFLVLQLLNAVDSVPFTFHLSLAVALLGVFISVLVGVISGAIPAWIASRKDPVIAIRK